MANKNLNVRWTIAVTKRTSSFQDIASTGVSVHKRIQFRLIGQPAELHEHINEAERRTLCTATGRPLNSLLRPNSPYCPTKQQKAVDKLKQTK